MTAKEIREKFWEFFRSKNHRIIHFAPLIPENDPTVLFTTAGMHPLVPYLLGEKHPGGKRVANVQICLRTDDIEEIGDNRHLTFFEMLGNWSFGDPASPDGIGAAGYFKKEAIEWSFEFLTGKDWLGLDPQRIYVSVFAGDFDAPRDEESIKAWQEQFAKGGPKAEVGDWQKGIKEGERIFLYGKDKNWWGPAGSEGPCGPDTEMFYDTLNQGEHGSGRAGHLHPGDEEKYRSYCHPNCDCGRFIEIWNDVFMEFNKKADGSYESLKQKNVDTGMGLERITAVIQNKETIFETELFEPIIVLLRRLASMTYESQPAYYRIIADHLRAATFILAENLEPSNVDRGYVLRRLVRRAIRYGKQIGIEEVFAHKVAEVIIEHYKNSYAYLRKNKNFILEQLVREEEKFGKTLDKGIQLLRDQILKISEAEKSASAPAQDQKKIKKISGQLAFDLYQTSGFPLEMTEELAREYGFEVDREEFKELYKKHQDLSRTASAGMFKGGLSDHSEIATKYHTATHLLLASLRKVLGDHVCQRGSNITAERLRFDFSHPQKMTAEQISQVESLVNQKIKENLGVKFEEMDLEEAKTEGAIGVFEQKYGERVKVYTIGSAKGGSPFSREICGGPHVENIGQLGKFKIIKEEASSAGVRRIKAVLE